MSNLSCRLVFLTIAIGLASACASTPPPQTRSVPHFDERLYHVYIVSNLHAALGQEWAAVFHRQFWQALDAERVSQSLEYWNFTPEGDVRFDTLEERDDVAARVRAFDPETVLLVLGARDIVQRTEDGSQTVDAISLWLFTPDDEELVWALAYGFHPGERATEVVREVLRSMKRDGLIRGSTATEEGP